MENQERGHQENQRRNSNSQPVQFLSVPTSSSKQYPYSPLSPSRNEIRLLRASQPFEVNDLISCKISHESLDQDPPPRYEALSYTWADRTGNAQLSKQVLLDGHPVSVTRNLEAALSVLLMRNSDHEKAAPAPALWVDALCINQSDIAERNAQVRKMHFVYQRAQQVVAWLGEEYDDSHEAFELLGAFRAQGVPGSICGGLGAAWAPGMALPDGVVRKTHAIIKLFQREYWTRAWVVQEVALAQGLVLYCGGQSMELDEMVGACDAVVRDVIWMAEAFYSSGIGHLLQALTQRGPNLLVRFEGEEGPGRGRLPHMWREDRVDVTLGELLVQHRMKKATDPKDKVYSLLGIVASAVQNRIPVDYGLDTWSLFQKVAVYVATEEQPPSLQILAENKRPRCIISDCDGTVRPCPLSWVPDWANTNQADKIRIDRNIRWASASGTRTSKAFIHDVDTLCVKGLRIGTITRAGPMMPDLDGEELIFAPVFDVLYAWWLMFLAAGKKHLIGAQGFVNFLFLGDIHRYEKFTAGEIENIERDIVDHLRVVLEIYRPDDETLISIVGRQGKVIDADLRRTAETDLWGIAPLIRKRKAFLVAGADCGIGPQCTEEGDTVVVVLGCKVPLVLRKRAEEDGGGYLNIGDAYVDGLMDGQAVRDLDAGKRTLETFGLH